MNIKSLSQTRAFLGVFYCFNGVALVNGDSNKFGYHALYVKDGAYYCYCAYVLRISRYSDFLSPVLTNTGIFLRGLKLSGERRS